MNFLVYIFNAKSEFVTNQIQQACYFISFSRQLPPSKTKLLDETLTVLCISISCQPYFLPLLYVFASHLILNLPMSIVVQERRKRSWSERKERWRESMTRAERVTDEWVQNEQQKALKAKMVRPSSPSGIMIFFFFSSSLLDLRLVTVSFHPLFSPLFSHSLPLFFLSPLSSLPSIVSPPPFTPPKFLVQKLQLILVISP